MADDKHADERRENNPKPGQEDLLSPGRALRESVGSSGSQRVGNNEPVANPVVSLPEEPEED